MIEEDYDRQVFRAIERTRLFLTLNTAPKTGNFVSNVENFEDNGLYLWGVQIASGLKIPGLTIQSDLFEEAMQDDSAKAMMILTEAREDVHRATSEGLTARAKNVASVLAAKLHLEQLTGQLPKRKEVVACAAEFHLKMFGVPCKTAFNDLAEWLVVFEQAGLEYLPKGR